MLQNILVVAVPAELVLAQAVDHVRCLECVFACVASVNGEGRVGLDDYARPVVLGEFQKLAMVGEQRI